MLDRLVIRDLALVERLDVAFGPGLNVVTGETGAGKSLLVGSLTLLLGGRADSDVVRDGARSAVVEGEFRVCDEAAERVAALLEEWALDFDGETLVLRREVSAEGRGRASVNQSPVTLASLKRLGELLADLHGQHEHQSLLRDGAPLLTLDRLAGLEAERTRFGDALAALREAEGERERLVDSLAHYAERRDYLIAAAREIDDARPGPGEDDALRLEAARLAHADRLRALAQTALERLSEGEGAAVESLGAARHALEQGSQLDPTLGDSLAPLSEAAIAAGEAARALAAYLDRLEADPAALEQVEARRDLLARLTRKYRRSTDELLAWRDELRAELATGEDAEGALARAEARLASAREAALAAARALSKRRASAAREWSRSLSAELRPLGFSHARVSFDVQPDTEDRLSPSGLDTVELLFGANPGEPARPLARIASGGELSRVMLALKCALQTRDRVDLLVFDEVDSGIGGAVAQAVGERLQRLAEHRQVICVTHLPMIAALASHHFAVSKRVTSGRTTTRIEPLGEPERVDELARMLAGDRASDTTRRQARELLSPASARAGRSRT